MKCAHQIPRLILVSAMLALIPASQAAPARADLTRPVRRGMLRPDRAPVPFTVVDGAVVATVVRPAGIAAGHDPAVPPKVVWDPTGFPKYVPEPELGDAVELLVSTVRAMTGRTLPVVEEGTAVEGPQVHVGRTRRVLDTLGADLAALDSEGYLHLSTTDGLLLVGGDRYGQMFAVAAFLEQHGGVRWLFPGPLGEVVPPRERWVLPDVNRVDEPAYRAREIEGISNWNAIPWEIITQTQQWLHRNGMRGGRYPYIHNLGALINPEKYGKAHPEWYSLIDGKRQNELFGATHNLQPCMAAPGLAEHVAGQINAYFDEHPEAQGYSIANVDGSGFCECDGCRAMDGDYANRAWGPYVGKYTNRIYRFFNRVAELVARKHPDKILGTLAYSEYIYPPDFDLHPQLMPFVCSTRDGYCNPGFKARDEEILDGWARRARQVGIYEYFYGAGFLVPRLYPHVLSDALRHAYDHGARAFTGESFPNWALDAPKIYCLAKVLWDPTRDVDAILDDFCNALFGPAAPSMRRVFQTEEQTWARPETFADTHWFNLEMDLMKQLRRYPPEVVAQLNTELAAARTAAGEQGIIRQRVEFFAKAVEMLNLLEPGYRAAALAEHDAPVREVLLAMREPEPVAERLLAYWKQNQFGPLHLYPSMYTDIAAHTGWGWGVIQSLEGEQGSVDAILTARLARRLRDTVLADTTLPGLSTPEWFRSAYRTGLDRVCERDLAGLPSNSRAVDLARGVRAAAFKVAVSFPANAPITLDGQLDDPAWAGALRQSQFVQYTTGAVSPTRTEFAVAHDADALYVAVWCEQTAEELAKVPSVSAHQTADVWSDQSVEIFLNRTEPGTPYLQVAVSRGGGLFAQGGASGAKSADLARCATRTGTTGWQAEVAIPWRVLGADPVRDRRLLLNLVRNRMRPQPQGPPATEISTWWLSRGWHHAAENRGLLLLCELRTAATATPTPETPLSSWANLLTNPGFEEAVITDVSPANAAYAPLLQRQVALPTGPQTPMPRNVYLNPEDGWRGADCRFEYVEGISGDAVHTGRRAMRLTSPTAFSAVALPPGVPVSPGLGLDDQTLVVGRPGRVSFFAKGLGTVAVAVYLYDDRCAGLYHLDRTTCVAPAAIELPAAAATTWQQGSVALTIPYPEVHLVQVVFRVRGTVNLDDVALILP